MDTLATLCLGNTHLSAVFWPRRGRPQKKEIRTSSLKTESLLAWLRRHAPQAVILSGVVPSALALLEKKLRGRREPWLVFNFRKDFSCPIKIVPRPEKKLGDDRLASALGLLVHVPEKNNLVLDFGTAVTVNFIRYAPQKGLTFEGGFILPGEALSLKALAQGTALLPNLVPWPRIPPPLVGRNTVQAMRGGIRWSSFAVPLFIQGQWARYYPGAWKIFVTGGGAKVVLPQLRAQAHEFPVVYDPLLAHRGLLHLWCAITEDVFPSISGNLE